MHEIEAITATLRESVSLPEILAASYDAFELIRRIARDCEDMVPALFPAFISAAGAAVEGRECIAAAPALPPAGLPRQAPSP